jgi:hypothetical protein
LEWINRFIGQPILKELAELTMNQGSITSNPIKMELKKGVKENATPIAFLRNKYKLVASKSDGSSVAGLTKAMLQENIETFNKTGKSNNSLNEEILNAWEFLNKKGKQFGDSVMAAKSDTQGAGGSNVSRLVNHNKIIKVIDDGFIRNYETKFQKTALGRYRYNTLNWAGDVISKSDIFLSGTMSAQRTFNKISQETDNGKLLVDLDLAKSIDNAFYTYIMSGTSAFKDNRSNFSDIVQLPYEISKRQEKLAKINQDRLDEGLETMDGNFLIQELQFAQRGNWAFIGLTSNKQTKHFQNQIYRAWLDLYYKYNRKEDGKLDLDTVHPDRQLAIDLVKYAFTASGFQNNLAQFFTSIPHEILRDLGLPGDIRDAIKKINVMEVDQNYVDQYQRHNKDIKNVVKTVDRKRTVGSYVVWKYVPAKSEAEELGTRIPNRGAQRTYPKFVKRYFSEPNPFTGEYETTVDLYEIIGSDEAVNHEGKDMRVPVYARTYELGLKEGKYRIVEYNRDENIGQSKVFANNLSSSIQSQKARQIAALMNKKNRTFEPLSKINILDTSEIKDDQEQRLESEEFDTMESFEEKVAFMKEKMDVEVIIDPDVETSRVLSKNDPRTIAAGKPVILINPNKVFTDTAFHEFGHIFVDSIPGGLSNPKVQAALSQLMGTELERELRELYPNANEEQFAKELLTTAIGRKATELWADPKKQSRWNSFKAWLMDFLRRTFGYNTDQVESLAKELISSKKIEIVQSEYAQEQRTRKVGEKNKDEKSFSDIEKATDRVYADIRSKVAKIYDAQKRISLTPEGIAYNKRLKEEGGETRLKTVERLKNILEKYDEAGKQVGLVKYIRWATKELATVNRAVARRGELNNINEENLIRSLDWNNAFDMIDQAQELLEAMKKQGKISQRRKNIIENVIGDAQKTRKSIKAKLMTWAKSMYLDKLVETDTKITDEYRAQFGLDYDALKESGEISEQKSEFINRKMQENKKEIKEEIRDYYESRADEAIGSLSKASMIFLSQKSMKSIDIQMIDKIISSALRKIEQFAINRANIFEGRNNDFRKDVSNSRDMRVKYEGMFETSSDGKSYFTGMYNPEFYSTFMSYKKMVGDEVATEEAYGDVEVGENKRYQSSIKDKDGKTVSRALAFGHGYTDIKIIPAESKDAKPMFVSYMFEGKQHQTTIADAVARAELQHFKNQNTQNVTTEQGETTRPVDKWKSEAWKKLSPQKKRELQWLVAEIRKNTENYGNNSSLINKVGSAEFIRLPGVMKSDVSRVQEGQVKTLFKHKVESIYKTEQDEFDMGSQIASTNIAGGSRGRIPVAYRAKLKASDQSFDLHTIVLMDSVMSENYKEKKAVEDILLVITEVMKEKRYPKYNPDGSIVTDKDGNTVYHEGLSNESEKAMSVLENSLYGKKTKEGKTFTNKDGKVIAEVNVIARSMMKFFGVVSLVGNVANSIVNASMGTISNFIESVGGEAFGPKELAKAQKIYFGDMKGWMSDMGANVVKSKTNMLLSAWNVMGDGEYLQSSFEKNTRVESFVDMSALRPLAKAGEHMMQATLMYAVMEKIKIQNNKGEFIDKNGKVVNTEKEAASINDMIRFEKFGNGAVKMYMDKMVERTTFTPEGGRENIQNQTRNLIKSKIAEAQGLYDNELQAHAQRSVIGKMGFFLRKWMLPGYERRFRGAGLRAITTEYDAMLETDKFYSADQRQHKEGYYVSAARFLYGLRKTLTDSEVSIAKNWDKLTTMEKANIKKLSADAALMILSMFAYGLMDEDDEETVFERYLVRRMISEMYFFSDPTEIYKVASTPTAGMGNIRNIVKVLDQVSFADGEKMWERYERGQYEDELKIKVKLKRAFLPRWKSPEDYVNSLRFLEGAGGGQ